MSSEHRRTMGFTFIEIMVVVVIIGILSAVIAPGVYRKILAAKINATKSNMSSIKTSLANYEMSVGDYPSTEEGLKALIKCPDGVDVKEWGQSYFDDGAVPKDGWGKKFIYSYPGEHITHYDLYSKGPDREAETEDDIHNWPDDEEGDL
jgi:general secretion pathway protein G